MFINEFLTHFHLLQVHQVGLGYLGNKGFLKIYGVVKRSLRGEFPVLRFIKDLGVLDMLWRKFLLHFLSSLGKGSGEHKFSNVRVIFS